MTRVFEFWTFPNGDFFLQLIHDPLTCAKSCLPMSAAHPCKQGRFSNGNKSDSVMNDYRSKTKLNRRLSGNLPQLVFGHFPVRFVIDSLNFSPILGAANNSSKIHCRARAGVDLAVWNTELRFCE
jgi:hypothetical protein